MLQPSMIKITPIERLEAGIAMYLRDRFQWGSVTDIALRFGITRQYAYYLEDKLSHAFETITTKGASNVFTTETQWWCKLVLSIRLYCNGSIDGIARVLAEMGSPTASTGHVSEILRMFAEAVSKDKPSPPVGDYVLYGDEIFSVGNPILVLMDAKSQNILTIKLSEARSSKEWKKVIEEIQSLGINVKYMVKDQGSGLQAAAQELGIAELMDLFHLLKKHDPILARFERKAIGAITNEYERERIFLNRKSPETAQKAWNAYLESRVMTQAAIRACDNYECLHLWLHEIFDDFGSDGHHRTLDMAKADLAAWRELCENEFPDGDAIEKANRFLFKNADAYWPHFQRMAALIASHGDVPEITRKTVSLAWHLQRKATAVKSGAMKASLHRRSEELMAFATTGISEELRKAIGKLIQGLNETFRSSSPLEAINSVLRRYLESCRGQTDQDSLELLAFFINHRPANRGKHAGTSAQERLTGEHGRPQSAIELIMQLAQKKVVDEPLPFVTSQQQHAAAS